MARYRRYRRYRRGYRRWRRYRRGRSRYSGSRRIINNSSRTRVSVKCKASQDVSLPVPANSKWSTMLVATPWIANRTILAAAPTRPHIFCAPITTSPAFTSFAAVYDEVRLTGVRYVINCRSNVGAGGIPSVTFHTCWVRSMPANSFGNVSPNFNTINTSPSAQSVTALNNTVNKFSRSCYPSDLFERIDFVNSQTYDRDLVVNNFANPPSAASSNVPVTMTVAAGEDRYEAHPAFFPVLYMCADLHGDATVARSIDLNITCYCTFEFRGPKYGNSSSSSASLATKGALIGGVAPDAGDDAPPAAQAAAQQAGAAGAIIIDDDDEDMLDADEAQHHVSRAIARTVIRDPVTSVQRDATRQRSRDRSRSRSRARQALNNVARAARFVNEHPAARHRVLDALDAAGVPGAGRANAIMDVVDAVADGLRDDRGDDEPPPLPPYDEL